MFKLETKFEPKGDQPKAIKALLAGIKKSAKNQTLLGVTGSGKTFTIANVIEKIQKPTLVIAPNKTLAAQLAYEFRQFFPRNAVEYFVSYYDYYQPEAYMSATDTYIEKEADINREIEKLRHSATASLIIRDDVIICASVSCIYGLGSPEFYREITIKASRGQDIERKEFLSRLVDLHYDRSEILSQGKFRARGNIIEIAPTGRDFFYRIELADNRIKDIKSIDNITRAEENIEREIVIWPAKHFVVPGSIMKKAIEEIRKELDIRLAHFKGKGKLLEAERLERKTNLDIEMMEEIGYCNGIENYSRFLSGRKSGQAPYTLIDYFPRDFLLVIDESHVTIPQLNGMHEGDRARKENLIEYGFRLPSALDNRPLKFNEFKKKINQAIFTSATPGKYERIHSDQFVEQIIRPTGLVDPELIIRPTKNQIQDLTKEIEKRVARKERTLVITLTKKMAEDLSEWLVERKLRAKYLHSEVQTLDRIAILEDLRRGKFDILVGVNLLREGLDLPEVSLVAILDADKEGFLRSETSLIQTIGRAARNIRGQVILYGDYLTGSMERAARETNRRRKLQIEYNKTHRITPQSIKKEIKSMIDREFNPKVGEEYARIEKFEDIPQIIKEKEAEMTRLAKDLQFEKAALVRDEIIQLKKLKLK